MHGSSPQTAFLRLRAIDATRQSDLLYALPVAGEVLLGRDPRCEIVLDSHQYTSVSRQHAKVCALVGQPWVWQVCDLESTNGTFLNGRPVQGCAVLQPGDRLVLGKRGPEFIFEVQSAQPLPDEPISTLSPTGRPEAGSSESVSLSLLFPIVSTGRDLVRKAYLLPGLVTVSFVVLMFVAVGNPPIFNLLVALYLSGGAFYFIYQLCGKHKPWWLLLGSALMTIGLLLSPAINGFIWFFREVLPGSMPPPGSPPLVVFLRMFFGAGLMEELLKAVPVLVAYWLGTKARSPLREQIGVWEPLDGILLGTASAVGFTLVETLGQYVPSFINDISQEMGQGVGQVSGLHLLIARILGSIAGHLAYSGYLGYFIGLSVLKPGKRWQILTVGYLTTSALHALWNVSGLIHLFALALVGGLSYAFLTAAILKARALSPTRSRNFATRFSKLP
ncbi:MAG TPA: PrsW family intramembrane metalloprotease [Synechococcales cyanobacterium M55_K2018_004]|nr:PrsW family intramembrane metalloprotease [Synechococcales cyanobacterium M55_K2018_004]